MEALRVLGNRYLFGLGVVKNCETSLVAYEKAARMLIEEVPLPFSDFPHTSPLDRSVNAEDAAYALRSDRVHRSYPGSAHQPH